MSIDCVLPTESFLLLSISGPGPPLHNYDRPT
jgi:hypothetical protein